ALVPGTVFENHDFLNTQPSATPLALATSTAVPGLVSICGNVWNDLDADGVIDPGEPTIPNVAIDLTGATGAVLGTQRTNAVGRYCFEELPVGTYVVREQNPLGFTSTNSIPGLGGSQLTSDSMRVLAVVVNTVYAEQDFLDTQPRPTVTPTEVQVLGIQQLPVSGAPLSVETARRWRLASRLSLFLGMALGVGRHLAKPYNWADVEWAGHSVREAYRWGRADRRLRRRRKSDYDPDDE
ncbi:MAG: SdrD B-like domain-containing protein, partial [Anaerolineales bacterium]